MVVSFSIRTTIQVNMKLVAITGNLYTNVCQQKKTLILHCFLWKRKRRHCTCPLPSAEQYKRNNSGALRSIQGKALEFIGLAKNSSQKTYSQVDTFDYSCFACCKTRVQSLSAFCLKFGTKFLFMHAISVIWHRFTITPSRWWFWMSEQEPRARYILFGKLFFPIVYTKLTD